MGTSHWAGLNVHLPPKCSPEISGWGWVVAECHTWWLKMVLARGVCPFELRLIIGSFLTLKLVPGGETQVQSESTRFVPPFSIQKSNLYSRKKFCWPEPGEETQTQERSDHAPVVLSPGNVVWGSPNHTLSRELVSPWWQPGFTDKTVQWQDCQVFF